MTYKTSPVVEDDGSSCTFYTTAARSVSVVDPWNSEVAPERAEKDDYAIEFFTGDLSVKEAECEYLGTAYGLTEELALSARDTFMNDGIIPDFLAEAFKAA